MYTMYVLYSFCGNDEATEAKFVDLWRYLWEGVPLKPEGLIV